jgi:hypothetical protein
VQSGRFSAAAQREGPAKLLEGTSEALARSNRFAVVVPQQAAETFPEPDAASDLADLLTGIDDPVLQALRLRPVCKSPAVAAR